MKIGRDSSMVWHTLLAQELQGVLMGIYLITGAAGFIAYRVAELLLNDGHNVVGVDNLNDAYDVRLKKWRLDSLTRYPNFTFHHVDISNFDSVKSVFSLKGISFNAVINLAARAGVRQSVENPWVYYETNVTGTLNLLELCRRYGIKKFILASTSSLYGKHNPMPYREDANTDGPLSPYAASKKAAETLCYTYHYLYGLDITVFRYFTVYGPAGRPDMSPFRFVQWIIEERPVIVYGDGSQSRDFTYVDDIAKGTILGLKPVGYEIINLGLGKPTVLLDIIKLIERISSKKAHIEFLPMHPADVPATWADVSMAKKILGWCPVVGLESGIRKTVEWYMENREWAKDVKT